MGYLQKGTYCCRIVIAPAKEGGMIGYVKNLPGVVSQGETIDEVVKNVTEAFKGVMEYYRDAGLDVPVAEVYAEVDPFFTERCTTITLE